MPNTSAHLRLLLSELKELRESCLDTEREFAVAVGEACPQSSLSVQNLLHYLALRKHDLRDLQARLAATGLSSLGRAEPSVLAGLDAVIAILEAAQCADGTVPLPAASCVRFETGPAILAERADQLLGAAPQGRTVRIIVTMPSEAAVSYSLIRDLVNQGMDVMRVNCAHDSEREWAGMIDHLRRANLELGKHCKVLMDLSGPKLRTGPCTAAIEWLAGMWPGIPAAK
jgi:pyruvate kinase